MSFPKQNPTLPEGINNSNHSPFIDFLILAGGLLLVVVGLSLAISWGAVRIAPAIPFSWEPDLALDPGDYDTATDRRIDEYLQTLTEQLIPEGTHLPAVKVHWLPDMEIANAFATSGGNIHVTHGLLSAVNSENGLAMVLAHEYAHVELRHPVVLMLEQIGYTLVTLITGFGDSSAGTIAQQGGIVSLMAFSRDMEREADARAVELLKQYYGHTRGSEELFAHMLTIEEQQSRGWGLWQSHPETAERIAFLRGTHASDEINTPLKPLPDWLISALIPDSER